MRYRIRVSRELNDGGRRNQRCSIAVARNVLITRLSIMFDRPGVGSMRHIMLCPHGPANIHPGIEAPQSRLVWRVVRSGKKPLCWRHSHNVAHGWILWIHSIGGSWREDCELSGTAARELRVSQAFDKLQQSEQDHATDTIAAVYHGNLSYRSNLAFDMVRGSSAKARDLPDRLASRDRGFIADIFSPSVGKLPRRYRLGCCPPYGAHQAFPPKLSCDD